MSEICCRTQGEFETFQAVHASGDLCDLVKACKRRFLVAAALVQLRTPAIERLEDLGCERPYCVQPLLPVWQIVCRRYVAELYSPQLPLPPPLLGDPFLQQPLDAPAAAWRRFVCARLLPELVQCNEVVRNVLASVGGLPCRDPQTAVDALKLHVREMLLPDQAPLWIDPETRTCL